MSAVRRRSAQSSCAPLLALMGCARFCAPLRGRPSAARPLWARHWRAVASGARAPALRGGAAPRSAGRRSFLRPGAEGLRPPPRLRSLLPSRPGKTPPGPFRSRAPLRFGLRSAPSLRPGPPLSGGRLCAALRSPGRGSVAPAALPAGRFPPRPGKVKDKKGYKNH